MPVIFTFVHCVSLKDEIDMRVHWGFMVLMTKQGNKAATAFPISDIILIKWPNLDIFK